MPTQHHPDRKMGFLEKNAILFQETTNDSTAIAAMIHLNNTLEYDIFLAAWKIMHTRHPMLRARKVGKNLDYSFRFDVCFDAIKFKYLKSDTFDLIDHEYSRVINAHFDTQQSLWRSTLITFNQESYIIIGASHAISDGKSLSWLLGDLLRCMNEIELGKQPQVKSYPTPEPLFKLLNKANFNPPAVPTQPPEQTFRFEGSPQKTKPASRNIY